MTRTWTASCQWARNAGGACSPLPGWQRPGLVSAVLTPRGLSRGHLKGLWLQMVTIEASLVTRCNPFFEERAGRGLRSYSWQFSYDPSVRGADRGRKHQNGDETCQGDGPVAANRTKIATMTRPCSGTDGAATNGSGTASPWPMPLPSRQKNTCEHPWGQNHAPHGQGPPASRPKNARVGHHGAFP